MIAEKVYLAPDAVESTACRVAFEYKELSFKTEFNRIKCVYQLNGRDIQWSPATRYRRVSYDNLQPGVYRFRVKAIDVAFNTSKVAEVKVRIIRDPRDLQIAELESQLQQRNQELEMELSEA